MVPLCGNEHLVHLCENVNVPRNTLQAYFTQDIAKFDSLLTCYELLIEDKWILKCVLALIFANAFKIANLKDSQ